MSQNLTISKTGLKLIKAFEGYRPVDRELITGQRIVGYGHRLYSEDAVTMNKEVAEATLRSDLEPFEDMINSEVHAPMTQSQFDALCSFAFNIGPKAFLQSDTLRAINNGRPLDAANGLDVWRKSEIDGKTYVVDALMRRRTAEKALFLRTERAIPAGREDLPPMVDTALQDMSTDDGLPVFTADDANGIVATAPYAATIAPSRRREDGPAGVLQLSERDIIEMEELDENESLAADAQTEIPTEIVPEIEDVAVETADAETLEDAALELVEDDLEAPAVPRKSPIAAAATDIVARLDALIDDADTRFDETDENWPDSLIDSDVAAAQEDGEEEIKEERVIDPALDDIQVEAKVDDDAEGAAGFEENIITLDGDASLSSETEGDSVTEVNELPFDDDVLSDQEIETVDEDKAVPVIDELAQDDAMRVRTDSAAKYIETSEPMEAAPVEAKQAGSGLWIPIVIGFVIVGLAGGAMIKGSEVILGQWGPIITFSGFVIGIGLILVGVFSTLRMNLRS